MDERALFPVMSAILLLLVQAAAGPPLPRDLRRPRPVVRPCPQAADGEEIIVCARPGTDQRIAALPNPLVKPRDDPMAFRLPGIGTGRVRAIQSNVGGFTGQGAAVTVTIPLGKKKRD